MFLNRVYNFQSLSCVTQPKLKPCSHRSFWNDAKWNCATVNSVSSKQFPYSKEQRTKHANYTSPFPEGREQKSLNKYSVEWDLLEWWKEIETETKRRQELLWIPHTHSALWNLCHYTCLAEEVWTQALDCVYAFVYVSLPGCFVL